MMWSRRAARHDAVPLATGVLFIVLAWAIAARAVDASIILPTPLETVLELWNQITARAFYGHLTATFLRTLIGFAAALVVGLVWGLASGTTRLAGPFLFPSLVLIRSTPVIAIILLALIWFRATLAPVFVTWLMVVPIVVENVVAGTRSASGDLREMASVFRVPRERVIRQLTLPALRPYLFATAHAGLGMAFKVTVAAEVIVQPQRALGGAMQEARFFLDTPRILALTLSVIALSALTELLLRTIERIAPGYLRGPVVSADSGRPASAATVSGIGGRAPASSPRWSPIVVTGVDRRYDGRDVLKGLSAEFLPSEITVVLGPSGCGKTTLLRLVGGLAVPDDGTVRAPARISMVFQEPRLLPWADASANIAFVLSDRRSSATIAEALCRAQLPLSAAAMPATLSGGMQQRLSLARAFARGGDAMLLDEPFQNLDLAVKLELARDVRERTAGKGVTIMVTHDVVEALATGDRILIMAGSPARFVGEQRVDLDADSRDPRSREHQAYAARLYDLLLSAR
jgi:NitT/TauT family transport system permease protein